MKDFEWFCLFIWGLWGNRNARFHRLKVKDVDQLIAWVSSLLAEFQSSISLSVPLGQPSPQGSSHPVSSSPPPPSLLKLNSDISVR
ncbi:hypothetical protein ACOSP7_023906 [Xanthoceras sorbifolium]